MSCPIEESFARKQSCHAHPYDMQESALATVAKRCRFAVAAPHVADKKASSAGGGHRNSVDATWERLHSRRLFLSPSPLPSRAHTHPLALSLSGSLALHLSVSIPPARSLGRRYAASESVLGGREGSQHGQCDRVAKVMDSKSIGLCPQGFESPRCRSAPRAGRVPVPRWSPRRETPPHRLSHSHRHCLFCC